MNIRSRTINFTLSSLRTKITLHPVSPPYIAIPRCACSFMTTLHGVAELCTISWVLPRFPRSPSSCPSHPPPKIQLRAFLARPLNTVVRECAQKSATTDAADELFRRYADPNTGCVPHGGLCFIHIIHSYAFIFTRARGTLPVLDGNIFDTENTRVSLCCFARVDSSSLFSPSNNQP